MRVLCVLSALHPRPYKNNSHTVESAVKDMEQSGWKQTKKLAPGNIIVWEEKKDHAHIGFYIGNDKAISNSSKKNSRALSSTSKCNTW